MAPVETSRAVGWNKFSALVFILAACLPSSAQDALPIHVRFAFNTDAVGPRFLNMAQSDVEKTISGELAQVCSTSLHPWRCDVGGEGAPALQVSLLLRQNVWYVQTELVHSPGRPLPDTWTALLFSTEDLRIRGLPMDDRWTPPIRTVFQQMLDGTSKTGKEILAAVEEFVPLGTLVGVIPQSVYPLPSAVLPLRWDVYKDIAGCRFRIYFRNTRGDLVILHSGGMGRGIEFTPDQPQYTGVLVVHEFYQLGALSPAPVAEHLQELLDLTPVEFYVEEVRSMPAGVAVAP
jgi:hypothetical protein